MRRIKVNKILVFCAMIILYSMLMLLTGCREVVHFDKNMNSYITEPFNDVETSTRKE